MGAAAEYYSNSSHVVVAAVDLTSFLPVTAPKFYFKPTIVLYPAGVAKEDKVAINYGNMNIEDYFVEQLVWITETVYPENEEFSAERGQRVIEVGR